MSFPTRRVRAASLSALFILTVIPIVVTAGSQGATGIVTDINKAPVIKDGNVQGQPFDMVITLDTSLDPNIPGRSLAAGDTIKIIFPDDFDLGDLGA